MEKLTSIGRVPLMATPDWPFRRIDYIFVRCAANCLASRSPPVRVSSTNLSTACGRATISASWRTSRSRDNTVRNC